MVKKRRKTKRLEFTSAGLRVGYSKGKGRGVFATKHLKKDELIEVAPILIIPEKEWPFVSSTMLANYFFETEQDSSAAIALGYASLYNHSFDSNADYLVANDRIILTASKDIKKGEEITVDYGWEYWHFYSEGIITEEQLHQALKDLEEEDEDN